MELVRYLFICLTFTCVLCTEHDSHTDGSPPRPGQHMHSEHHHHHYYAEATNNYGAAPVRHGAARGQPCTNNVVEGPAEDSACRCAHAQDRLWRFQIGDNFGPYEYLDHEGYLTGFHVDLIKAVCKQADKRCVYVLDSYKNCWNTADEFEYPGVGLMARWYDGCVGLLPTPDRLNSFNFSLPFGANYRAALHFKEGVNITDPRNITGMTIGYIDGWAVGRRCLERQFGMVGVQPGMHRYKVYSVHEEMVSGLLRGEVDAILSANVFEPYKLGLVVYGPWFQCTLSGVAMMSRYGEDTVNWWNEAFLEIKENGSYRTLCNEALVKHGHRGRVRCVE